MRQGDKTMKLTDNLYFYPEKGMLDSNTYVIKGAPSIIIDPGSRLYLAALLRDLQGDGIQPEDIDVIANTHLHGDHCWANEAFKEASGAKILCHPLQKSFWDMTVFETASFLGFAPAEFAADGYLNDTELDAGDMRLELIHTPGHSPDSICFFSREEGILICGDVIFKQSMGRVDLPGGDAHQLKESIEKLSQLPVEYLLPGHMDVLIGAEEVRHNFEFVKGYMLEWL